MSVTIPDRSGVSPAVVVGDPNTKGRNRTREYILANNITLAPGQSGPRVTNIESRSSYLFFTSMSGTSPSLQLQYLGDDGNVYPIDAARTANGSGSTSENIGEGATVFVTNTGANPLTNVYASLR